MMKEPVPRNMESVAHGEAGDMDTALAVRARDLVLIPPGSEVLVATFEREVVRGDRISRVGGRGRHVGPGSRVAASADQE